MPAASRPPVIVPNVLISNALTYTEQSQELFFQLKEFMVLAGATIVYSKGGGVAGAGGSQIDRIDITGTVNGVYTIPVNGENASFTASGSTMTQIRDGLIAAINALVGAGAPVTAYIYDADSIGISADVGGVAFTIGALVAPGGSSMARVAMTANGVLDNIQARAAVDAGAAGTGSYFIAEWPASSLSNSVHRKLVYVATHPAIGVREGPGTWVASATPVTALPTLSGTWTTAQVINFHSYGASVNLRWSSWRTSTPSRPQRFVVKLDGAAGVGFKWEFVSNDGANGSGNERWASSIVQAGSGYANISGVAQSNVWWNAINSGGSADTPTLAESTIWRLSSAWGNGGLDGAGVAHPDIIRVSQNVANGRSLGTIVDTFAIPLGFGQGNAIDADEVINNIDPRRVAWGEEAFYWPAGVAVL